MCLEGTICLPISKINYCTYAINHIMLQLLSQVFCTVSGAGSKAVQSRAHSFDVALIDEAAQLVEAEACIILAVRSIPSFNVSLLNMRSLNPMIQLQSDHCNQLKVPRPACKSSLHME